ncbi:type II toxin-antitoxin system RelE/ParE family toxin [Mesorhizobium sp. M2E.F.Ca.ET.219.01.1.1]|uniref:type II toxin-antitoxin system RelE/ParE family toxin n=1 Tax=Mesorhizobium sp. M2E.F.Ca.ET.219.01.1.1 TaxID=2500530 RepID=UPI0032AF550E
MAEVYRFIATQGQSRNVALAFVRRIHARCRKIGDAPNGGRPRDDLQPGLRTVPFERSTVIAYRVGKTVEIVNVFYGGRDYEALYGATTKALRNKSRRLQRGDRDHGFAV